MRAFLTILIALGLGSFAAREVSGAVPESPDPTEECSLFFSGDPLNQDAVELYRRLLASEAGMLLAPEELQAMLDSGKYFETLEGGASEKVHLRRALGRLKRHVEARLKLSPDEIKDQFGAALREILELRKAGAGEQRSAQSKREFIQPELSVLTTREGPASLAFLPSSKRALLAHRSGQLSVSPLSSAAGAVRIVEADSLVETKPLEPVFLVPNLFVESADGRFVAGAASYSSAVYLWETRTGEVWREFRPKEDASDVRTVSISADGQLVVSADYRGRVIVWNREKDKAVDLVLSRPEGSPRGGGRAASIEPDAQTVLVVDRFGRVSRHRADTGSELLEVHPAQSDAFEVARAVIALDGNSVVLLGATKKSEAAGRGFASILRKLELATNKITDFEVAGNTSSLLSVSPRGRYVVVSGLKEVFLVDTEANQVSTIKVTRGTVHSLAFTPDAGALYLGTEEGSILRYELPEQE